MREPMRMGLLERKKYERSLRRRRNRIKLVIILLVIAVLFVGGILLLKPWELFKSIPASQQGGGPNGPQKTEAMIRQEKIAEARYLAQTYAYDEAVAVLETVKNYEKDDEVRKIISSIKAEKSSCVRIPLSEVTHIFYHSLVVDEERAFGNPYDSQCDGNNQWMTTMDEFIAITEEMYRRGFVIVSIHDLYEITVDENGKEVWKAGNIYLPKGKKAVVLSLDDLSYYHSYDGYGYATRLILDENGNVVNEYHDKKGNEYIGAYDCVPLLDEFIKRHPDASYKGAKGTIALTGYNGVLGYRTDETYDFNHPTCDWQQKAWMNAHPDFNLETERANAKAVADAMKANGWTFASHTWGHRDVGNSSLSSLKKDTERWKNNVEPIVGETNVIIFAHGTDLEWKTGAYTASNAKYQYFREQGYRVFCNVDSTQYQTYLGTDYLRQGRRNIDGYRIYQNAIGKQNNLYDLFDAEKILDPDRPPVPDL